MGLTPVSVYAEDDLDSPHVRGADRSVALPGGGPAAYLDIEAIVAAAKETGAGLVHPGYGFLSESPELARRCAEESLLFVGPSVDSLALLGDKVATRELADSVGVPVLEATPVVVDDRVAADFLVSLGEQARVMVKAAGGGGGVGCASSSIPLTCLQLWNAPARSLVARSAARMSISSDTSPGHATSRSRSSVTDENGFRSVSATAVSSGGTRR